ncbi:MAG TPA: aa3-type cytochrome c oxidase subunit IV [Acetobacteraceae bacterium]|nr:aa3-type cytochrome c oxidase subunit IV [Acetobacteraceae bacterium]
MAEQQTSYEFVEVKSEDILRDRQQGWDGFTRFVTWSIALTVIILALMAFFLV